MKILENFLIALGIKVDEKSFQKADAAFGGLTRSALQLGAVFAGKLAIDKVVGDFKSAGTQLDNFNRLTGLSTQKVQLLGQAIAAQGGNADDAFTDMKKLQDLMASPITGNVGWFGDAAKYGLDPNEIVKANDTAEALANIAGAFEKMTPLNQRLTGEALGFSENTVRLLMKGREAVEQQLDVRGKLGVMTRQQVEDAARLTRAMSNLDGAFTDIGNTIAGELAPAFAEMAEDFVEFYAANKDLVDSGLKEFFGELADNIQLVAVALALMGGASALKGLMALRSLLGLGAAGAGAGAGAGAAAAGASAAVIVGGSALSALYSSSLNEGEEAELEKNRRSKYGIGTRSESGAETETVNYLMKKGLSEALSLGIAANIQKESAFNPQALGDGGKAYGLLQWHPDRQAEFAKFAGKDIRSSNNYEQLDFLVHEITNGLEKEKWKKVKDSQTPYQAAANFSEFVVRPAAKEKEKAERGEIAQSYLEAGGGQRSTAPEVSDEELTRLRRGYGKSDKAEQSLADQAKTWLESLRQPAVQQTPAAPVDAPVQAENWQPVQREAPREYTVNAVVQPPAQQAAQDRPAAPAPAAPPQQINDNRQFHIHGADAEQVKKIYNEQLSTLTEQTAQAFRSPEK